MYLLHSHKITLKHAKFWVFLQVLVHTVFLLFMKYEVLYFSLVLEFYCFLSLVPFGLRRSPVLTEGTQVRLIVFRQSILLACIVGTSL